MPRFCCGTWYCVWTPKKDQVINFLHPQFWQCQELESACHCHPSLTVLEYSWICWTHLWDCSYSRATLNMPLGSEESAECSPEQGGISWISLFSSLGICIHFVHLVHAGLSSSSCLNLMCRILATLDTVLMASLMFYLAGLSLYMFCRCQYSPRKPNFQPDMNLFRAPNPTIATTSDTTLKIYGLNSSIIPVSWIHCQTLFQILSSHFCIPMYWWSGAREMLGGSPPHPPPAHPCHSPRPACPSW